MSLIGIPFLSSSRRFLTTIVKIEGMLQSWFPHIKATVSPTDDGVSAKRQKVDFHFVSSNVSDWGSL